MKLDNQDLSWAIIRLPYKVRKIMQNKEWENNIFVGGGYIRSVITSDKINDIDLFVKSKKDAELLANILCVDKKDIYHTDNAYTVKDKVPIQIIHRWTFNTPEEVSDSFDFTICCAVIFYNSKEGWHSFCDDRFYIDLASKRLIYRKPIRNEDAGGSMLRVLKYYQKGYRIPLDSLGAVIARLMSGVDYKKVGTGDEEGIAFVITGLLREVDPTVDPLHLAHLPSTAENLEEKLKEIQ